MQLKSPTTDQKVTEGKNSVGKPGIGKTFGIVAVLTVLSKIAGLLRDMVVASCYGTSIVADAYNYAYMFTGNIFILFGGLGGPFHSATVTVLGSRKGQSGAGTMITQVFVYTFLGLSAISIAAGLAAPWITSYMASQYNPSVLSKATHINELGMCAVSSAIDCVKPFQQALYQEQLLAQLWIMLPLIVLAGLVGISYGILNVYNKVFWPSLSPAIASLAIIVAVCLADPHTRLVTGIPLAVGTLAGAIGQLIAQLPGTVNTDLKYKFEWKPDSGFAEYCKMLWPAIFSTSVGQLIVYVDCWFTLNYLGEGAWTAIIQSNRLVQLPLGVLLTAMLVPILPRFTEQAASNRIDDLKEELRRALRFLWFLSLPLTAMLLVLPGPIIQVLFQRGNFNAESTAIVSLALLYLTPSIFFYVARDLMTRVFYAFKDSKTPYHVALIAIVVKACLDWFFVTKTNLGVAGLSTASTVITLVNLTLLTIFLKRKVGGLGFAHLVKPVAIMLVATALCAGTVYGVFVSTNDLCLSVFNALKVAWPVLANKSAAFMPMVLSLGVSCFTGLMAYLATCIVCKLDEPRMLTARLPIMRRLIPAKKID